MDRIEALRARAPRRVELIVDDDSPVLASLPGALERLERTGERLAARWTGPVRPLLDWLGTQPSIRDATIVPLDLEELFLVYYQSDPSTRRIDTIKEDREVAAPRAAREPAKVAIPNPAPVPRRTSAFLSRALVLKSFRDSRGLITAALIVAALFEVLNTFATKSIAPMMMVLLGRFEFFQRLFQAQLRFDPSAGVSPTALLVMGQDPFLSVVAWVTLVTIGTRVPAGEIDRGTADLLLSLPISRASVYVSSSVVWLLTAVGLAAATWSGVALGTLLVRFAEPVDLKRIAMVNANHAALLLAIGGTTALVSCLVNRRGVAVGIVAILLLASFLVDFLAAFLPVFARIEFLGFLNYYRPLDVVREGRWPVRNLCLLGAVAVATWTAGLLIFRRKNIPAT
jgi:ABC-type transport system involved in multi-copper enzyme maturation permease subunit